MKNLSRGLSQKSVTVLSKPLEVPFMILLLETMLNRVF
jgi:hypothetical protein